MRPATASADDGALSYGEFPQRRLEKSSPPTGEESS